MLLFYWFKKAFVFSCNIRETAHQCPNTATGRLQRRQSMERWKINLLPAWGTWELGHPLPHSLNFNDRYQMSASGLLGHCLERGHTCFMMIRQAGHQLPWSWIHTAGTLISTTNAFIGKTWVRQPPSSWCLGSLHYSRQTGHITGKDPCSARNYCMFCLCFNDSQEVRCSLVEVGKHDGWHISILLVIGGLSTWMILHGISVVV